MPKYNYVGNSKLKIDNIMFFKWITNKINHHNILLGIDYIEYKGEKKWKIEII